MTSDDDAILKALERPPIRHRPDEFGNPDSWPGYSTTCELHRLKQLHPGRDTPEHKRMRRRVELEQTGAAVLQRLAAAGGPGSHDLPVADQVRTRAAGVPPDLPPPHRRDHGPMPCFAIVRAALGRLRGISGPRSGRAGAREAARVAAAVRDMVDQETGRVDDPIAGVPGGHPSDRWGWRAYAPLGQLEDQPGRPLYDPEAWRWFSLVDVAVLDRTALVKFAWTEPGTPALQYLTLVRLIHTTGRAADSAFLVRAHLRHLLAPCDPLPSAAANAQPGWRNRAHRTWLSRELVVVSAPRTRADQHQLDLRWDARDTS